MAEETKEERLNNDEFRELMPHLELEDLFKIQIKNDKEWVKIFKSVMIDSKEVINCNLCIKHIEMESFKSHLKEQTHKDALKNVTQFYHPVFTYDKKSEKIALGEPVSEEELTEAIKLAKAALERQPKSAIGEAKRLSKLIENLSDQKLITLQVDEIMEITCFRSTHKFKLIIESRNDFVRCNLCQMAAFNDFEELNVHFKSENHVERAKTLKGMSLEGYPELNRNSVIQVDIHSEYAIEYNKVLISLLEKEIVKSPHLLRIFCDLELKDILKLEHLIHRRGWKPMFIKPIPHNESVLKCTLCNKTLVKYSINSHCSGKQHKTAQLAAQIVRHQSYKNISKIYIFCLSSKYKVKTSLKARTKYHEQVLKVLKKEKIVRDVQSQSQVKKNEETEKSKPRNVSGNESMNELGDNVENELENDAEPEENENNEDVEAEENENNEDVEAEENGNENVEAEDNENENIEADENEGDDIEAAENEDEIVEVAENDEFVETEANENLDAGENEDERELEENEDELEENDVEIIENESEHNDQQKEDETVQNLNETENIEEPNAADENADIPLQKELSSKIAAKAKALRDASFKGARKEARSRKSSNDIAKYNTSAEKTTPENALIGVEYVVKILKYPNDQEPMFECCLCEVLRNHTRMQNHLTGYNHRFKYCEMHYGNAFNKFSASLKDVESFDMFRTMGPILAKLACEIEKVNGRSIPYAVSAEEFEVDRTRIIAQLYGEKHGCQLFGPSFTNILSDEDIQKIVANKDSFVAPKTDKNVRCRFRELTDRQRYCKKKQSERKVVFKYRAKAGRDEKERPSQRGLGEKTSKRLRGESSPRRESSTNNVWQIYRREILLSASQIEREYKEFRKCPDSHPSYDQEWNRFWKERKDDLVSRGIDPRNYNFQTEWVPYFKNRLEQLFGEALERAKLDVRIRLSIPFDAIEDSNFSTEHSSRMGPPSRAGSQFEKPSRSTRREPQIKKPRVDTESLVMQWNSQRKFGQNQSRVRRQENLEGSNGRFGNNLRDVDEKPNLIHVLRLMTAFEDYLGSLGPKITDLLFSTLTLEKQIPQDTNLLEQKILTPNNCSLLETAMEKLKGTLLAGLLDSSKEPGLNRVIDCTTNLLTHADNMGYLKQFQPVQNLSQGNRNSQFSSNIQDLMTIMTGVKGAAPPHRLNNMDDFSGRNIYDCLKTIHPFQDFQSQQFGNNRSISGIGSKSNMDLNTTDVLNAALRNRFDGSSNNAPRVSYSNSQMPQRNMNMTGLGGNSSANMNMANIGGNNYNNSNLNNQNANNNDRNFANKGNLQNTGPPSGYWNPFSGGNPSLQQNSSGRMWQQNNTNSWQGGGDGSMPGLQQQNFRQQQNRQKR